jgi:hypothetical protein
VTAWLSQHPRLRRGAVVVGTTYLLAVGATCLAPDASASTNAAVLDWTGLHDGYGVPIGDYYLAMPSVREQLTQAGPTVGWNPESWAAWTVHALAVIADRITTAGILTAEAGLFVGLVALALWVLKVTVSTYWLTVIGELARTISTAVVDVTTRLGLLLVAIPLGVFVGVITVRRGEVGRGWTMILVALTLPALSATVFADPTGQMYGPDGLLAFGRNVGFSVAQAGTQNGSVGDDGIGSLTASLITHTVREPLQLWNFGHVVDRVGGCGGAWSEAVRAGMPDGPITAMRSCGDQSAVAHALMLDGTNIWVGAVLVFASALLAVFMVGSGWAVLKVSVKAIWTTVILLPALWLGAVPGAPQRRATAVVWQFFRHGIEVCVYIVYVSVIGLAVQRMVSAPLPPELGGTSPFAHVLMMAGVSMAALMLLRHIRAELTGSGPGQRGMLGRASEVALGMGLQAAVGGTGSAVAQRARGMLGSRRGGAPPPWETAERATDDAGGVHGAPQPGFDPVPGGGGGGEVTGQQGLERSASVGDGGAAARPGSAPVGVAPVGEFDGAGATARARGSERTPPRGASASRAEAPDPGIGEPARLSATAAADPSPPSVPPIAESDYRGATPLPPEPSDDEPPPEHPGSPERPPTTVDPIKPA